MRYILVAGVAAIATSCTTPGTNTAETKPDPRQGQEVKQICFNDQIRNWRANDNRSVIVEKGLKQEYKLELLGTCQPQDAFTSIGLISRVGGGLCLSMGDRLVTDARYDGPCTIRRMYEWHQNASNGSAN